MRKKIRIKLSIYKRCGLSDKFSGFDKKFCAALLKLHSTGKEEYSREKLIKSYFFSDFYSEKNSHLKQNFRLCCQNGEEISLDIFGRVVKTVWKFHLIF